MCFIQCDLSLQMVMGKLATL